jgi:hypothetical protein
MENDIYEIAGRIKNIIAKKDIALSPVGNILVNSYALVLKDLYDFADTLPMPLGDKLVDLLISKEGMPEYVIRLSQPKENKTLYEQVMEARENPQFGSTEEALKSYSEEYEALGGDGFWLEAESSSLLSENHRKIMRLSRSIGMCKHLIQREKDNSS